jgi:hypothetical protein
MKKRIILIAFVVALANLTSCGNDSKSQSTVEINKESVPIVKDIVNDNTKYYIIEDPDGYSNLRELPDGKVIRKVYNSEKFEITGEEKKYKKVKFNDASTGYIHNSRVVNFNVKVCECLNSAILMVEKDLDKDPEMEKPSLNERLLEIFRNNQCPKGCDFLGDEDIIDFQSEIQRCSE